MNLALSLAESMDQLAKEPNEGLSARWSKLLNCGDQTPEFYMALAVIYGKFLELRGELETSTLGDRAKGLYLSAVHELLPFVNPTTAHSHNSQQVRARGDKIDLLHLAAEALPHIPVPDVQPPIIEQLCVELEDIRQQLKSADVDPETRRFVGRSLAILKMVLQSYDILGPEGAAQMFGSAFSDLVRSLQQKPAPSGEGKSILQRLVSLTKKVGAVVIWTSAVVGGADNLLTDGSDIVGFLTGDDAAQKPTGKKQN